MIHGLLSKRLGLARLLIKVLPTVRMLMVALALGATLWIVSSGGGLGVLWSLVRGVFGSDAQVRQVSADGLIDAVQLLTGAFVIGATAASLEAAAYRAATGKKLFWKLDRFRADDAHSEAARPEVHRND